MLSLIARINLLGPLTSLAVRKAFRNGLDGAGAMMLSLYAVFIQDKYQEFTRGHALGRIATAYFDRDDGSPFAPPTYKIFASHIAVWSDPIRETFPDFRKAISYAISYGDGIHLGFGSAELCGKLFFTHYLFSLDSTDATIALAAYSSICV